MQPPNKLLQIDAATRRGRTAILLDTVAQGGVTTGDSIDKTSATWACPVCARGFSHGESLRTHMRVHGFSYREAGVELGTDDSRHCPLCDRVNSGSRGLRQHLLMAHGYSKEDAAAVAGIVTSQVRCPRSGIYFLRHPISHRVYVGQAVDLDGRLSSHLTSLEARRHPNLLLQLDYELLQEGGLTFEWGVLAECPPQELDACEREFIEQYDALGTGYNLALVGHQGSIPSKRAEVREAQFELAERWSGVSREHFERLGECLRRALQEREPFDGIHSTRLRPDLLKSVSRECEVDQEEVVSFHFAAWSLDLFGLGSISDAAHYGMVVDTW